MDALVAITNSMYNSEKQFKDQLIIRFLPAFCICMVWLYVCVYNHPQCLFQGKGFLHCYIDKSWTVEAGRGERGTLWTEYFDEYYQLTIAMIFGSLIAGSTPLGGGVVAFPVVVLIIGLTPDQGRDFSVSIQSVGMNAAAFLLCVVKGHLLDFKFISVFTVIGTAGVLIGLSANVKPYTANMIYTVIVLEFAFLYFYTNVVSPRRAKGATVAVSNAKPPPGEKKMLVLHTLMIGAAILGGFITANVGSGSDIMLYAFGIYVWNVFCADTNLVMAENKLTASSVVVMGLLSIVTMVARACTAGISMNVWYCLGACSWLVCWGAPLGSLLLTPELQMTLRASFYVMSVIQFSFFAALKIKTNQPPTPKGHWGSWQSWLVIGMCTAFSVTCMTIHFKIISKRYAAQGGVVPLTFMGAMSRLLPLDKFMGKDSPTTYYSTEPKATSTSETKTVDGSASSV